MGFVRRLFSRGALRHDRRPGVYITRSTVTGDWNAPAPARMDQMEKEAAQMGREDCEGGQHSPWTHAPKPAAIRHLEARRDENLAAIGAEREAAVELACSAATAREREVEVRRASCAEAQEAYDATAVEAAEVSEVRHGFAAVPRLIGVGLALLLMAADILFTEIALVQSLGNLPEWEAWAVSGIIGVLLFSAGIGKAYIEAVGERAEDERTKGPFSPAAGRTLIRFVLWPTVLMVSALAFARIALIDWESETIGEWVAAIGAFVAVSAAAVLVAVVAYLGGRILFASWPVSRAAGRLRRAAKERNRARAALGTASKRATDARAVADGLAVSFDEAAVMAQEAWMAVIALYWRGFAQARPDEQPDIDMINALTNGHRDLDLSEVTV